MIQWWDSLTQVERLLAMLAIPSTLILFIQTLLLLLGLSGHSGDSGEEADTSHFGGGEGHDAHFEFEHDHDLDGHVPDELGGHVPGELHDQAPIGPYEAHIENDHGEHHAAGHDSGLRVFTIRGFVAFFSVFGWTGLAMLRGGMGAGPSVAAAFLGGTAAMVGIALVFRVFMSLQQDGTADISYTLGRSGTVYLTVPAARSAKGKVNVLAGDRLLELDAVTDNATAIRTGEEITVVGLSGSNTVVVRPKT